MLKSTMTRRKPNKALSTGSQAGDAVLWRKQKDSHQLPIPWVPHGYQRKGIKFLLQHAAAGLFLDPGLGKTSITLAAVKILKKEKLLNRVLLVAPLRVCYS